MVENSHHSRKAIMRTTLFIIDFKQPEDKALLFLSEFAEFWWSPDYII